MTAEELKALLGHFADEAWQQGNLAAVDELIAADYVLHDPVNPLRGREAFKQYVAGVRSAFPDLQFTIDDLIVEEHRAVARWTFRGTHKGQSPNLGIPPTGKRVTFSGVAIYHIVDGKIVEEWNNLDTLGLLKQLGIIPVVGQGNGSPCNTRPSGEL